MSNFGKKISSDKAVIIHALTAGAAYFVIVMKFIVDYTERAGLLLAFFFFPAIVCGSAVVLIKKFRACRENGSYKTIAAAAVINAVLLVIAVITAIYTALGFSGGGI